MYDFRWLDSALDALADIYVAATVPDRERMATGVERFNRRIALNPNDVGESRDGGYRVDFPPLLVVYFHVDDMRREVEVTFIARFGR